jgi:hypothetical protein
MEDLRFSWHSHGNLGVSWSGTDEQGVNKYLSNGVPWLASIVVNRDGDMLGRLDIQGVPIVERVAFKNFPVERVMIDRTEGQAARDVEQFVSKHVPRTITGPNVKSIGKVGSSSTPGNWGSSRRELEQARERDEKRLARLQERETDETIARLMAGEDLEDIDDDNLRRGDVMMFTALDIQKLETHGHDVSKMSDDEMLSALMDIDFADMENKGEQS